MQFRNATYNAFGTIDCEIDHPAHGWIPFTASPDDVEPLGCDVFAATKDVAAPYVTPQPDPAAVAAATKAEFRAAVQAHVDATAQVREYDNGASCASYVASTHEPWRNEALAFLAWRDAVWQQVTTQLAAVEAGEAEPPASADALIGGLPVMEWPATPAI